MHVFYPNKYLYQSIYDLINHIKCNNTLDGLIFRKYDLIEANLLVGGIKIPTPYYSL